MPQAVISTRCGRIATPSPGRKFVFAHFLLPHHPYLFDRHGHVLSDASIGNEFNFQWPLGSNASAFGAIALRQRRGIGRDHAIEAQSAGRRSSFAVRPRTAAEQPVERARAATSTAREPRRFHLPGRLADIDSAGRLARQLLQAHPEFLRGDGVAAARQPALLLGVSPAVRVQDVTKCCTRIRSTGRERRRPTDS